MNRIIILLILVAITALFIVSCTKSDTPAPVYICKDADSNSYPTVRIGNQVWMAKNLHATKSRTGEPVESFAPNGDTSNIADYGRLYKWNDAVKACPKGWRLPTYEEIRQLQTILGDEIGNSLKERGTLHWLSPNRGATNSTGFSAVGAGIRDTVGFKYFREISRYWTSSSDTAAASAWTYSLSYEGYTIFPLYEYWRFAFSVRCIKDDK